MTERKDATAATKAMNDKLLEELPFEDRRDFQEAERGFIAPLPDRGVLKDEDGGDVWNTQRFSFVEEGSEAPETVNPRKASQKGRVKSPRGNRTGRATEPARSLRRLERRSFGKGETEVRGGHRFQV